MKLKQAFVTHQSGDKQILIDAGGNVFSGLVRSNKTAAFIVDQLKTETSKGEIVDKMLEKYDAPRERIAGDVDLVLAKLRSIGALEE